MKQIIAIIAFTLFAQVGLSQSPLGYHNLQANAGLGINNSDGIPVILGVDFGLDDLFTIGAELGVGGNLFTLGANGNYHFDNLLDLPTEWNIYGGANLGFYSAKKDGASDINLNLGLQAGTRYFFSDQWAANLEIGGGSKVSGAKLGATYIISQIK